MKILTPRKGNDIRSSARKAVLTIKLILFFVILVSFQLPTATNDGQVVGMGRSGVSLAQALSEKGRIQYPMGAAQPDDVVFAVLTDIHIGYSKAESALLSSIEDINKRSDIQFVLVPGDLTSSGSDKELLRAKSILDRLNKRYYTIAGNHENVWSESGGTSLKRIFGDDKFAATYSGYLFVGIDCGPLVRHGTAHIPHEHIQWLDSLLQANPNQPTIFVNHFPLTEEVDNSTEVLQLLKKYNTQLAICGHWHTNKQFDFSGIPGALCRSNLPERGMNSGYTIATIANGEVSFSERVPVLDSLSAPWMKVKLNKPTEDKDIAALEPEVIEGSRLKWSYEYEGDLAAAFATDKDFLYTGTAEGKVIALRKSDGRMAWTYYAGGRIVSRPAIAANKIVFTSTNGSLSCISAAGKLLWTYTSQKAVVASPAIHNNKVYTGFSDGSFRCFDLKSGKLIWSFDGVHEGFVQSRPTLGKDLIYFGAWNSKLYCLDIQTGKLKWEWTNHKPFSYAPAALPPVLVDDKLFIVTPDDLITCFNASTGDTIWQNKMHGFPVRFSRGLSSDGKWLYLKTNNGKVLAIATQPDSLAVVWHADIDLKVDGFSSVIIDRDNVVFIPTEKGEIYAISKVTGKLLWCRKVGTSPIIHLEANGRSELFVADQKGQIIKLKYRQPVAYKR